MTDERPQDEILLSEVHAALRDVTGDVDSLRDELRLVSYQLTNIYSSVPRHSAREWEKAAYQILKRIQPDEKQWPARKHPREFQKIVLDFLASQDDQMRAEMRAGFSAMLNALGAEVPDDE